MPLGVALHWEAAAPEDDHANCAAQWVAIAAYHKSIGDGDNTAYNWGYCQHGGVFTGKGWDFLDGQGRVCYANAPYEVDPNANKDYWALCFMSGPGFPFTDPAKIAVLGLISEAASRGATDVQPHSHFFNTACPGDDIRAWITAGLPSPTPVPIPIEGEPVLTIYVDPNTSYYVCETAGVLIPITDAERTAMVGKGGVSTVKTAAQVEAIKAQLAATTVAATTGGVTEARVKELIAASRITA